MWENGLLAKIKLNSRIWEFKTSQNEKQILKIHILPNILRSKENLTMKFGQLIEYVMNIFLEISYTKCGGEGKSRPIYVKSKLSLSLDQQSEILYSLFLSGVQVEVYQTLIKLRCWTIASTSYNTFWRAKKKSLELFSLPHILHASFLNAFISLNIGEYVYCNCLFPRLCSHKFWN